MELDYKSVCEFQRIFDGGNRFLMLFDRAPDGDQIGASYALGMWLRSKGKTVVWNSLTPVPDVYKITNFYEEIKNDIDLKAEDYDAIILNDCGDLKRTLLLEKNPNFLESSFIINIDHHPSNRKYGDINLVYTDVAATCEIVHTLLKELGAFIDPEMATYLLMGLYADTGGFIHANTTSNNLAMSSSLIQRGADIEKAYQCTKHLELETMKAWGKLFKKINVANGVCFLFVDQKILDELNIVYEDLSGVSSLLATVPNIKYALLITDNEGEIKGSARTNRDDIDVMKICELFGGGGHQKAAGFVFKSDDEGSRKKLFDLLGIKNPLKGTEVEKKMPIATNFSEIGQI